MLLFLLRNFWHLKHTLDMCRNMSDKEHALSAHIKTLSAWHHIAGDYLDAEPGISQSVDSELLSQLMASTKVDTLSPAMFLAIINSTFSMIAPVTISHRMQFQAVHVDR